jgi:hypothetical protein
MHLQKAVHPFDLFVRCLAVGPQMRIMRYDPEAPLHDRYKTDADVVDAENWQQLADLTLTINSFFGWDFNSCEALRQDGIFHPIDFANANPDSQVTSLHFHIPWLVKALIRWSLFCAATRRKMRHDLEWNSFFEIAESIESYPERLAAMADLARRRFDADRFDEFCQGNLAGLDDVTHAYFASDHVRGIIHKEVASKYPEHEIEDFTAHFWNLIQQWRESEQAESPAP